MKPLFPLLILLFSALLAAPAPAQSPARAWKDYEIIMWQPQTAERFAALRRLGISAGMVEGARVPLSEQALAARIAPLRAAGMPWYVENIATDFYAAYHRWTPDHPLTWLFDQARQDHAREPTGIAGFIRQPSLSDPDWLTRIAARLRTHVVLHQPYRPLFYDLADEAGIANLAAPWDFDFSAASLAGMRDWLHGQYAGLAALNAEWGSDFADWNAVIPITTDAALARTDGNYAAWADFKAWMDVSFARALRTGVDAVHQASPAARAAIAGAQIPGWGGYDYSILASVPDVMELYNYGDNIDIAHGFNAGLVLLTTSFRGGPREMHKIWRELLLGTRGLILWDEGGGFIGADGAPGPRGRDLAATFAELRGGLGARVIAARPQPDPVAILYSQASFRTIWLLDRRADPTPWTARTTETEYADNNAWRAAMHDSVQALTHLGLHPTWLSPDLIDSGALRNTSTKLLILPQTIALSAKTAREITAFTARGGTVVTDTEPGRFDAHSRRRQTPALDPARLRHVTAFSIATLAPLLRAHAITSGLSLTLPDKTPARDVEIRRFASNQTTLLTLQRDLPAADQPITQQDYLLTLPHEFWITELRHPAPPRHTSQLHLTITGDAPTLLEISSRPPKGLDRQGQGSALDGTPSRCARWDPVPARD